MPVEAQDAPTTGKVLAVSPNFNKKDYPDVVPGANVKVEIGAWSMFRVAGQVLAFGHCDSIISTYDWDGPDTIAEELEAKEKAYVERRIKAEEERRAAVAAAQKAVAENPDSGPKSPLIRMTPDIAIVR